MDRATRDVDLTEFLLARIAEDEQAAGHYHRLLCMRIACDNEGCIWRADEEEAMERERVCTCGYPARIHRECEAKRGIVARMETSVDLDADERTQGQADEADVICEIMARIWSDHPDYREAWYE